MTTTAQPGPARGESAGPDPLSAILAGLPPAARRVLDDPAHAVQVRYTRIDRDAANRPRFTTFEHGAEPGRYFYPASTVKFPAALLALEKLHRLRVEGLGRDTRMEVGIDPAQPWQTAAAADPTAPGGHPTVGHYVRKIFLVSDNDAFNRLYEFIGQAEFNAALEAKGYTGAKVVHRLSLPLTVEQNRHTNPVRFLAPDGRVLLHQPAAHNPVDLARGAAPIPLGEAHFAGGERVARPMDFAAKNAFPLAAQQQMLAALLFPAAVPAAARFDLAPGDREFVLRAMSGYPRESDAPRYDPSQYPDAYLKFLGFGGSADPLPAHLRVFNKSGLAYGTLTDNAYFADFSNRVEVLLAATVYANANRTLNDDTYEYQSVALPFLRRLGQAVYRHELGRPREHRPDLSELRRLR